MWRFANDGFVGIGGTDDVSADGPATSIFLHKSLNYISIANIILCKIFKRTQEMRQPRCK